MHQIRFQLGLCSRPYRVVHGAPQTPRLILGALKYWILLMGGRGEKQEGNELKGHV